MAMLAMAVPPPQTVPAPPARVLAFADEFHFNTSRAVVRAGRVILQVKNIGEDDHDLRIKGPNGVARAETGRVRPGGLRQIRIRLPRGRYTYLCTVADHAERGMTGTLVVRAAKKTPRRR
ncbi:MAG TPA: hypothetical protein VFG74_11335 [Miltoncostaeaceae bacterium]|jgi:uncharacterized cupredoxin-like copper-binding protein|nr:hypothetical protein [Miltoncostaeaceae bacterium]